MGAASYSEYLSSLGDAELAALLRERPEGRAEPLPSSVDRLALRLASPDAVASALARVDRDAFQVVQAIGVLGDQATASNTALLLGAPPALVTAALDRLTRLGLIWAVDGDPDGRIGLVDVVREIVHEQIGGEDRSDRLARHVRADELRGLARAHGVPVEGLRKPEVVEALTTALGDVHAVVDRVLALPDDRRERLHQAVQLGVVARIDDHGRPTRGPDPVVRGLVESGMVVLNDRQTHVVPTEIAVAHWLADAALTGPPEVPTTTADTVAAASAAVALVGRTTTLLDRVATTPIPALKSGGIGKRERARLSKALEVDDGELCLLVDLAAGAGLLGLGTAGFTTTGGYDAWRRATVARRWAELADAWWCLALPSTRRLEPDGTEVAPPLGSSMPLTVLRRGVVETALPDRSLGAVTTLLDWYRPLVAEPSPWRDAVADATVDEAGRLGLVVGDAPTPLAAALASGCDVEALATLASALLVEEPARLQLQSDLTAVLSGHPDAELARLLDVAADVESRGAATTLRFSATTVRRALDAGWTAETVLERLGAAATGELPQPLTYLVGDAARRHGTIRAHETRTCVVADEASTQELEAARALRMLRWRRLAPTVLATHAEPAGVLSALRDAGYSPVLDDGTGSVAVERTTPEPAPAVAGPRRALPSPEEAVARIRSGAEREPTATAGELAALNARLDDAELELLADAVDHETPVRLTYRSNSGGVTRRVVTPIDFHHRWIDAWCHLRDDERAFTVSSILAVAPS